MNARSDQLGVVLISVLWVVAGLSMIVASGLVAVRTDVHLTRNHLNLAQARSVAEAGIYWGIYALLTPRQQARAGLPEGPVGLTWDDTHVTIEIENEAGKIDINTATDQLMEGALVEAGVDPSRARVIVQNYARGGDRSGISRSVRRFKTVEDFTEGLEIPDGSRERITAWLTVYNGRREINPMVSNREVLLAVPGVNERQVDQYLEQRQREPLRQPDMGSSNRYFTNRLSSVYTITAHAKLGGLSSSITSKVRLSSLRHQPYKILEWRSLSRPDAT